MRLAPFDLDPTLLPIDRDSGWSRFRVRIAGLPRARRDDPPLPAGAAR